MTLDVSIATYKPEGIKRVEKMLLPPQEGVRYIVSWQEHEDYRVPESMAQREDVEICRLDLNGLSNNRNNGLEHCKGDIVLIADDDLKYTPDFATKIIEAFERNRNTDICLFKINYIWPKVYPDIECRISVPFPKNYFVTSGEIAMKRASIKDLKFWSGMGLGNNLLGAGEDELFIVAAIKKGKECRFINEIIATNPAETTGDKVTPGILRGQGFIISLIYPVSSILRIPLKAFRISKAGKGKFFTSMKELFKGAIYKHKNWESIPKECRW